MPFVNPTSAQFFAPGAPGADAYQIWLGEGNTGSRADFLASQKGPKGDPSTQPGPKGDPGQPGVGTVISRSALSAIPSNTNVVDAGNNNCVPADTTNPAHRGKVLGFVAQGVSVGVVASIQTIGPISGVSGSWSDTNTLYVGPNGSLVTRANLPANAAWQQAVATATANGINYLRGPAGLLPAIGTAVDSTARLQAETPSGMSYVDIPSALVAGIPKTPVNDLALPGLPAPYLGKIVAGQIPVLDMFSPYRNGVNGDEPLINAILNGHNACRAQPVGNGIGPILAKDSPIIVPQNGKFGGVAGRQRTEVTRLNGYTGDTLQMGSPTVGMGSAEIEGLWFTAPGRFIGAVTAGTTLGTRLTAGQAHIRAYGSQSGIIRNCGGFPIPYFIAQQGGYDLTIEHPFTIGGIWDRTNTALQEAIAVLVTNYDPIHGHPACTTVVNPNWVGGNISAETRSIPLYTKSYACQERIGPKYGWLHAAGEDCQMLGGFVGGFNRSPVAILPGGPAIINNAPAWVQIKLSLLGVRIDESMWAGIEALRTNASQAILTGLKLHGCEFNGQLIGAHGLDFSPSSLISVAQLDLLGNDFNAYQGAGARFYSVSDGTIANTRIRGYNNAGFDTTKGDPIDYGVGMIVGGLSNYLAVSGLRSGGGANAVTDPNNCQWGFVDTTPTTTTGGTTTSNQNNSYRYVRAVNLGLTGGAAVSTGVNDTGP